MKKQWRMIIISGGVLVALLLTWLISSLVMPGTGTETTATTTAAVPAVFEAEETKIAQIDISSANGGFTLLPEQVKDKDGKVSVIWSVKGKTGYPFSASTISDVVSLATLVYASSEIASNVTDLSSYGLDKPAATLTVTLASGEKNVILFGKEIVSGYYDYVTLQGSGRVCTVASTSAEKVKYSLLDLLNKDQLIGIEQKKLTGLVFNRARDNTEIDMNIKLIGEETDENSYQEFTVTKPIKRSGSSDSLTTMVTEATAAAVDKFIELDPKDLAKYGLDKPQYTFKLQSADKTVLLKLGTKADSSNYYAICDTIPAVFTIAASAFTTIDMKVIEMLDRFVCLQSIWTVSQIDADLFGTRFSTEIAMTKDQKAEDEGVVFKLDGKDAKIFSEDDDSLYSSFYQKIIGIMIAGLDTEAKPVNTHTASLTFHIKEDTENKVAAYTKKIEFVKRDDYNYYVFIDGEYAGFYVDGEDTFTSKKTDDEGILVAYKKLSYAIEHAVDGIFNTEKGYQLD